MEIPKLKKNISAYLGGEEGKISKQSLVSMAAFISAAAVAGVISSKEVAAGHTNISTHTNQLGVSMSGDQAVGNHNNALNHQNFHTNHSSY